MNILFILNTVTPQRGGVSMVSYVISNKMKEDGHNVFYLYNHFESFPEYGDKQFFVAANTNKTGLYRELKSICKECNINVIINQTGYSKQFIYALKRIKHEYHEITINSFLHASPDYWLKQMIFPPFYLFNFKTIVYNIIKFFYYKIYNKQKKQIKALYSVSDKFFLLSRFFINDFINIYNISDESKLDYINNPCMFNSKNEVNPLNKRNQILVVGRLSEKQKRMSIIIRIWKHIEQKYPDWNLVFVGNGPNKTDYEKLVKKYKLKNIQFDGQQPDTSRYYRESKIFLMTSIWEGWGLTLVEALSFKCVPILFDNFGACHDIIKDEVNGILIPNNDEKLFVRKVMELIEYPNYLEKLQQHNDDTIERFSINSIYAAWKEKVLNMEIRS